MKSFIVSSDFVVGESSTKPEEKTYWSTEMNISFMGWEWWYRKRDWLGQKVYVYCFGGLYRLSWAAKCVHVTMHYPALSVSINHKKNISIFHGIQRNMHMILFWLISYFDFIRVPGQFHASLTYVIYVDSLTFEEANGIWNIWVKLSSTYK